MPLRDAVLSATRTKVRVFAAEARDMQNRSITAERRCRSMFLPTPPSSLFRRAFTPPDAAGYQPPRHHARVTPPL